MPKEDPGHKDELTLEGVRPFYVAIEKEEWKLSALCDHYETLKTTMPLSIVNGASSAQTSFLRTARSRLASGADLAGLEVMRLVRDLARKRGSGALTPLTSRMSSAMQSSQGRKPVATGDLRATTSDLAADQEAKATSHHNCMTKASTFEAETKSLARS